MAWSLHVCVCAMGEPVGAQAPAYPSGKPPAQMAVTVLCQWCCVRCYVRNKSSVWRLNTRILALHQALALTSASKDFSFLIHYSAAATLISPCSRHKGNHKGLELLLQDGQAGPSPCLVLQTWQSGNSQKSQALWFLGPGTKPEHSCF